MNSINKHRINMAKWEICKTFFSKFSDKKIIVSNFNKNSLKKSFKVDNVIVIYTSRFTGKPELKFYYKQDDKIKNILNINLFVENGFWNLRKSGQNLTAESIKIEEVCFNRYI